MAEMSEPRRNEDPAAADYRGHRAMDEAKFSTQRVITYCILGLFAAVTVAVFLGEDPAERSTVLQTIINFTVLAIGFWLGASKWAADAAAHPPTSQIKADDVKIEAPGASIDINKP